MRPRFKPCPICGNELDADHNLLYSDEEGEIIDMFDYVSNYDDVTDPRNACRDMEDWEEMDDEERAYLSKEYEECIDAVESFIVHCSCGYRFVINRHDTSFPAYHWLDEVKELANRRYDAGE